MNEKILKERFMRFALDVYSLFWFSYINGVDQKWQPIIEPLKKEGDELLSIIVASIKTSLKQQY